MRREADKNRAHSVCSPETIADTTDIHPLSGTMTWADRWDHFLARCSYKRNDHRVEPGLYALGIPGSDSPIFVTANYTLSFDALRSALAGMRRK